MKVPRSVKRINPKANTREQRAARRDLDPRIDPRGAHAERRQEQMLAALSKKRKK